MKPYSVSATKAMGVVDMKTPAMGMKEQMNTNSDSSPMPAGSMASASESRHNLVLSQLKDFARECSKLTAARRLKPPAAPGICMPHMPSAVSPVLASAMRACIAVLGVKPNGCCYDVPPEVAVSLAKQGTTECGAVSLNTKPQHGAQTTVLCARVSYNWPTFQQSHMRLPCVATKHANVLAAARNLPALASTLPQPG